MALSYRMDEMKIEEYSSIVQWFRNQWYPLLLEIEVKEVPKIGKYKYKGTREGTRKVQKRVYLGGN